MHNRRPTITIPTVYCLFDDVHTPTVQVEHDPPQEIQEQDLIDIDGTLARVRGRTLIPSSPVTPVEMVVHALWCSALRRH